MAGRPGADPVDSAPRTALQRPAISARRKAERRSADKNAAPKGGLSLLKRRSEWTGNRNPRSWVRTRGIECKVFPIWGITQAFFHIFFDAAVPVPDRAKDGGKPGLERRSTGPASAPSPAGRPRIGLVRGRNGGIPSESVRRQSAPPTVLLNEEAAPGRAASVRLEEENHGPDLRHPRSNIGARGIGRAYDPFVE